MILKITAIVFGTIPFIAMGLFFIAGGPDPGGTLRSPLRFFGIPLFLTGVFWALPAGGLAKIRAGLDIIILLYGIPGASAGLFFLWLGFSTDPPSLLLFTLLALTVLAGIGCAALYHVRARKKEEEFRYVKTY